MNKLFKNISLFSLAICTFAALNQTCWAAESKIKIVTTTSTFASIAKEIAGDKAEIYYIASPSRDIHYISPTPKDILKVRKADVFIHAGLDLEAWRIPLLDAVGRTDLMPPSGKRAIDVSKRIPLKEIPTSLSRAQGDIHAFGNPHYWLSPSNAKIIADNIAEGFSRLYPADADSFNKSAESFKRKIDEKIKEWQALLAPYKGEGIVVYHNTWPYFMDEFGLKTVGFLEPKPGIPPTPKHMEELVQTMKERKSKLIVKEVFHENRAPKKEQAMAIMSPATTAAGKE